MNEDVAEETKQTEQQAVILNEKPNLSALREGELDVSIAPPEELEADTAALILGKMADGHSSSSSSLSRDGDLPKHAGRSSNLRQENHSMLQKPAFGQQKTSIGHAHSLGQRRQSEFQATPQKMRLIQPVAPIKTNNIVPSPRLAGVPDGDRESNQPRPESYLTNVTASQQASKMQACLSRLEDEPLPLPSNMPQGSINIDMKLGWRPTKPHSGAPIPLYYDFASYDDDIDYESKDPFVVPIYLGPRIANSLLMHRLWCRQEYGSRSDSYIFKFPPRPIAAKPKRVEDPQPFLGMNPKLAEIYEAKGMEYDQDQELVFDSFFECGNLDMAQKVDKSTYNLYMRTDTNTRGHHQWFYFSVAHTEKLAEKKVTFNILNFTKEDSLYAAGEYPKGQKPPVGMRVVYSRQTENYEYKRGGEDIGYQKSELMRRKSSDPAKVRYYFSLTFTFEFKPEKDKVFFSYCYPYTFSKLQRLLKDYTIGRDGKPKQCEHVGQTTFCKSLSGVDVPLLTVTSRVNSDPTEYNLVKLSDFEDNESKVSIPINKRKKFIIITGRVHPGESNSSWMMQGFIKAISGNSYAAKQLRKRIVFKIIPMLNVDGVIAGNYRTSMSGSDLNRRYIEPDPRLHPEICAVKELISDLLYGKPLEEQKQYVQEPELEGEDIMAFVDMHGHSRKKNVFVYGPQYMLSSEKYYRSRLIPKLLSEETSKFRYHSCQFKYEASKRKTARIVLNQEFDIMNCYTLEASFHAHYDDGRQNFEFTEKSFEEMGEHLVNTFWEYTLICEEEDRQRQLRVMEKRKRRRQMQEAIQVNKERVSQDSSRQNRTAYKTQKVQKNKRNDLMEESKSHMKKSEARQRETIRELAQEEQPERNILTREEQAEEFGYQTSATMALEEIPVVQPNPRGIRCLKSLFQQLDEVEDQRKVGEKIEEEELGFNPEKEEKAAKVLFDNKEVDPDSDAASSDLGGQAKNELLEDICGALDDFSNQYSGNTSYKVAEKRMMVRKKVLQKKLQKIEKAKQEADRNSQPVSPVKRPQASKSPSKQAQRDKKEKKERKPTHLVIKTTKPPPEESQSPRRGQGPVSFPMNLSGIGATVPSHHVTSRPKETEQESAQRVMHRQRLAQQGILNRIGVKAQTQNTQKIIPLRQFLENKYLGTDMEDFTQAMDAQITQFQAMPQANRSGVPMQINRLITSGFGDTQYQGEMSATLPKNTWHLDPAQMNKRNATQTVSMLNKQNNFNRITIASPSDGTYQTETRRIAEAIVSAQQILTNDDTRYKYDGDPMMVNKMPKSQIPTAGFKVSNNNRNLAQLLSADNTPPGLQERQPNTSIANYTYPSKQNPNRKSYKFEQLTNMASLPGSMLSGMIEQAAIGSQGSQNFLTGMNTMKGPSHMKTSLPEITVSDQLSPIEPSYSQSNQKKKRAKKVDVEALADRINQMPLDYHKNIQQPYLQPRPDLFTQDQNVQSLGTPVNKQVAMQAQLMQNSGLKPDLSEEQMFELRSTLMFDSKMMEAPGQKRIRKRKPSMTQESEGTAQSVSKRLAQRSHLESFLHSDGRVGSKFFQQETQRKKSTKNAAPDGKPVFIQHQPSNSFKLPQPNNLRASYSLQGPHTQKTQKLKVLDHVTPKFAGNQNPTIQELQQLTSLHQSYQMLQNQHNNARNIGSQKKASNSRKQGR